MNDFDDQRLRDEFNRRAPRGVSVATAHESVLDRSGRIRRRRVAVAGTGALLALVVGGLVLLPRGDGDSQAPADSGLPIPSVEVDGGTDDASTSTTTSVRTSGREVVTGDDGSAPSPTSSSGPATSTTVRDPGTPTPTTPGRPGTTVQVGSPASTAPTTPAPSPTTSSSPTTTTSTPSLPPSSSTTEPSLAPFTRTYDSAGGSISVDWDGDSFTLLSVAPAPGFEAEIEDQHATRVRVRFRGDDDSRIEVRVDKGKLSVDVS